MKKNCLIPITILLLVLLVYAPAPPEVMDTLGVIADSATVYPVASQALVTFEKIITHENYDELGFDSKSQIKSATLGLPLRVHTIWRSDLINFTTGTSPCHLLKDSEKAIFPIMYNNQVKSGITVYKDRNHWRAISYGRPNFTKILIDARLAIATKASKSENAIFTVHLPDLYLDFIAYYSNRTLYFSPVVDLHFLALAKGDTLPADSIIKLILPFAQNDTLFIIP